MLILSPEDKINFNLKYKDYNNLTFVKELKNRNSVWFCEFSNDCGCIQKVAIKFAVYNKTQYNDIYGLKYETEVYNYIQRNIIDTNESINFVGYVGCLNVGSKNVQQFLKSNSIYTILITEDDETESLNDVLSLELPVKDTTGIFTQIFYALLVMQTHSLLHGDLHNGNVRVKNLKNETKMCFQVDEEIFTISSKYLIKIFDWDFSYCKALGDNPQSTFHRFIPKEDLRKVISVADSYAGVNSIFNLDLWFKDFVSIKFNNNIAIREGTFNSVDSTELLKQFNLTYPFDENKNYDIIVQAKECLIHESKEVQVSENFDTIIKYTCEHDVQPYTFYLTKQELDFIFGEENNPFSEYDHCCFIKNYDDEKHYIQQQFNFDTEESANVLSSLKTPLELFKKYATLTTEKSDGCVQINTKIKTFKPKEILLSFNDIKRLANLYKDVDNYRLYACVIHVSKLTNDYEFAKQLLEFVLYYNFGVGVVKSTKLKIFYYQCRINLYKSKSIEEYMNEGEMTEYKFNEFLSILQF